MYLLYADESGSIDDPNGDFFVLAGISIFERQTHWLDQKIETVAQRFNARFASGKCEFSRQSHAFRQRQLENRRHTC